MGNIRIEAAEALGRLVPLFSGRPQFIVEFGAMLPNGLDVRLQDDVFYVVDRKARTMQRVMTPEQREEELAQVNALEMRA